MDDDCCACCGIGDCECTPFHFQDGHWICDWADCSACDDAHCAGGYEYDDMTFGDEDDDDEEEDDHEEDDYDENS